LDSAFGVRAVALLESLGKVAAQLHALVHGVAGWLWEKFGLFGLLKCYGTAGGSFRNLAVQNSVFCRI